MKGFIFTVIAYLALFSLICKASDGNEIKTGSDKESTKPRVIIMSDFPPLDVIPVKASYGPPEKHSDPDDLQSMVRFLLYTNDFDVEGLIASAGTRAHIARKQHILDMLDFYDRVDENLRKHDQRYPTTDQLRAVTWQGRDDTYGKNGMKNLGEGMDT